MLIYYVFYPLGSAAKSPVLPPITSKTAEMSATELRQAHMEKEKTLMDTLQTQMMQKKRTLDDRLKRKREQRMKTESLAAEAGMDNARVAIAKQEEEIAEAELAKLQGAYNNLSNLVKETGPKDISRVDMEAMMTVLDTAMKGQHITELPKFVEASAASTDETPKKTGFGGADIQQQQANKILMQDEVSRISANYNEEKQKLDLTMKIEQARQRSNLQRKLLAKKQGGARGHGHQSAGYPGDKNIDLTTLNMTNSGGEGKVYNDQSFRMPKGLMNAMSSRGMGLAPITRK